MASMSKVLRVAAVALAVTAVAGGCGGGGEKSAAPAKAGGPSATRTTSTPASTAPVTTSGSGDFCSKISDAEASAVLGVPIGRREQAGPSSAPTGVGGCIKGTPRQALSNLSKGAYVSFSTFPAGGELGSFDMVKAKFPDAKVLAGLGDQALFSPSGGLVMGFLDGKVFSVQVIKAGKPANEADAVTLAKAFLGRIS